eukprot:UN16769
MSWGSSSTSDSRVESAWSRTSYNDQMRRGLGTGKSLAAASQRLNQSKSKKNTQPVNNGWGSAAKNKSLTRSGVRASSSRIPIQEKTQSYNKKPKPVNVNVSVVTSTTKTSSQKQNLDMKKLKA